MKIEYYCLIFFSIIVNTPVFAMELNVSRDGEKLIVYLLNNTHTPVVINHRMAINATFSPLHELSALIINEEGKIMPFFAMVNLQLPQKKDYSILKPGSLIGRKVDLQRLTTQYHNLTSGKYSVQFVYQDQGTKIKGAFRKKLFSNKININVP